ncbi:MULTISPECIES: hypothetical protein [Fischerella]|nr:MULTISPECIES: hypothetical protein [Fischerella]MBD2431263.1 hypothetical protein [Fischerella sp. FACHB-380]
MAAPKRSHFTYSLVTWCDRLTRRRRSHSLPTSAKPRFDGQYACDHLSS